MSAASSDRDAAPVWVESAALDLGHPRVHLRHTDSTNERARELAVAGAPHGTLVTAAEQSAGRGRQGRRWSAPGGQLAADVAAAALAAPPAAPDRRCGRVRGVRRGAAIKWPNDVVVPSPEGSGPGLAKLAGILVEGRPQEGWAVLGIGINVAVRLKDLPEELRPSPGGGAGSATGLPAATLGGEPGDVEPTLARLLDALGRRLAEDPEQTLEAWRARDALRAAKSPGAAAAAGRRASTATGGWWWRWPAAGTPRSARARCTSSESGEPHPARQRWGPMLALT